MVLISVLTELHSFSRPLIKFGSYIGDDEVIYKGAGASRSSIGK
jgi:hypothetical protein